SGDAELVVEDVGGDPAYGLTELPDGDLLVAEWSGRILRVNLDTREVSTYTELPARIYQIASDGTGVVYAASYDGNLLRIEPNGVYAVIPTGFGVGRFVALAVTPDGTVFVAERGGSGRILRIDQRGQHHLVFRRPGAEFYGLALARDHFVYALDLASRELLRFPLDAGGNTPALAAGNWRSLPHPAGRSTSSARPPARAGVPRRDADALPRRRGSRSPCPASRSPGP